MPTRASRTSPATNPVIERFLRHCHRRHYSAGTVIVHMGAKPDVLYYIVKGSVAVLVDTDEGHEMILAYLNAGDFFGEMGLFIEEAGRTARVRARKSCEIAEISYSKFRQVANDDPDILFALSSQMAIRLRRTSGVVRRLAFMDVQGRVAATLRELCTHPDAVTHPEGMQLKITRQELARMVGSSREMVGRVLKNMEQQNLIRLEGRRIIVLGDRDELRSGMG